MKTLQDDDVVASTPGFPSPIGEAAEESSCPGYEVHLKPREETGVRWDDWGSRSVRWRHLMKATQAGDNRAYEQLLREVDAWLSRYYARRLPHPAAEDARQDVLLAIHAKRHTYNPSRPFGAWITAIARYKWIDRIRDASRYSALSLDEEIPIEGHEGAAIGEAGEVAGACRFEVRECALDLRNPIAAARLRRRVETEPRPERHTSV